jgi:hypothetical protein
MPPAARKTPARKPAAKPSPLPPVAVSPLAPVFEPIEIVSAPEDAEVEMVDLFSIDGRMFQVPARPPFSLALRAISTAREQGNGMAELMILEEVVGPEAWEALCNAKGVTGAQIGRLANAVSKLVLGGLEDEPSGNS